MKKSIIKYLMPLMLAFVSLPVVAQDFDEDMPSKPNVFIDYFSRSKEVPYLWAEDLRGKFLEGLLETNRVSVIDVDSYAALKVEEDRRKNDNITCGDNLECLAVMTQEGANVLISGTVTGINTEKKVDKDNKATYYAVTNLTLKVINPKDGKLISTKNLTLGDNILESNYGSTEEEAVLNANNSVKKEIKRYVDEVFKVKGQILEVDTEKKGEAKKVFVSIGEAHGVAKDVMFDAYIEREVAGRKSRKVIGELKLVEIQGDDISLCEVSKGGKEIMDAINGGQVVKINNKPKKLKPWEKL